jgi:DNA-binding HxlR family transcriptional regulator
MKTKKNCPIRNLLGQFVDKWSILVLLVVSINKSF